jgi:phage gpG-like protein
MAIVEVKFTSNKDDVLAMSKEKIYAWLEAIGEDAAGTSAKFAPADTGRLRGSISPVVDEAEQCVYIGTNVEYAIWHEFGTGKYASDGGGRATPWAFQDKEGVWHYTHGVPARHFIQFGCTAHLDQYGRMLEEKLKE